MPAISFRLSESDFVTAHAVAFRAQRWTLWVMWLGLGVALLAAAHAAYGLATDVHGLWTDAKVSAVAISMAAYAGYMRRWGRARRVRRVYQRTPGAGDEMTVAWSDTGLALSDQHAHQTHGWGEVRGWRDAGTTLAIWLAGGITIAIPLDALDRAARSDLLARLQGAP